ncbi:PepSY-associated TM helix domain-containing protein [Arcicella sp. DC2W]|uniref:PepSY-associated TM helix domain-containing protein n=1 Tax=Arcicella gelida TaxID=2984195 RepID=A0ABU5S084_9BACT|nr:PepSY-associated TM helix domain-containing protein [Arcicella sp. DC2W]MEA5401892.1 PepSY-associated TM helix domain-containing protein [Arcicella sp. DC2W]
MANNIIEIADDTIQKESYFGGIKKKIKRNIYRWHRIIGLITMIPVIFWCISGMMHPFMSHWFKVKLAHEFVKPEAVNQAQIKLSLQEVLNKNEITEFKNFRIVNFNNQTYYQVKRVSNRLAYFNATDAKMLENGDKKYAEFLARYFTEDQNSAIKSIEEITDFDEEYAYVNRLLPVWKVSFDRADGMDIYVETEQTRLANFNENRRKAFLWVFRTFHNWDFLTKISNNTLRISIMISFLAIIIISMISGLVIYGFMWGKFKKPRNANDKVGILRKYHRQIGLWVAFVTFTFAFSGAYHATKKLTPDERIKYFYQPSIKTADLQTANLALPLDWTKVSNLSLATIDDKLYYQVFTKSEEKGAWKKEQQDKAEKMSETKKPDAKPNVAYYDVQTASILPDGIMLHAKALVGHFIEQGKTGGDPACCELGTSTEESEDESTLPAIASTGYLTKFDKEYGFVNKRLPVVKLALATDNHLTYYVEPATSRLAAQIVDSDRREGLSFGVLHKFLFMDWAGKDIRDIATIFSALGVLVVSLFGFALFLKVK